MAVSVITGMAGIGKTRLAVDAAHQLRRWSRLEDVQLYVDMRGHSPVGGPADPAVTLVVLPGACWQCPVVTSRATWTPGPRCTGIGWTASGPSLCWTTRWMSSRCSRCCLA